jgi:hypothetical protein
MQVTSPNLLTLGSFGAQSESERTRSITTLISQLHVSWEHNAGL